VSLWHPKFTIRKWERYADLMMNPGEAFTPTDVGFFIVGSHGGTDVVFEYWSDVGSNWNFSGNITVGAKIGDGTNLRIRNTGAYGYYVVIMRAGWL